MKKLLFNIPFIVGSSLLFIQCAKLFPTHKAPVNKSQVTINIVNISNHKNLKSRSVGTSVKMAPVFKAKGTVTVFNTLLLQDNMMAKIDGRSIFYGSLYQF